MQKTTQAKTSQLSAIGQLTWASCNNIRKKAMQQEFSWSGLVISLSVAFFVVATASYSVSLFVGGAQAIHQALALSLG